MFRKKENCGQTAAEYALLVAVVLVSFVGMRTYAKRGLQAALRNSIDEFGPQEAKEILPKDVISTEEASKSRRVSNSKTVTKLIQDGEGEEQLYLPKGEGTTQVIEEDGEKKYIVPENTTYESGTSTYTQLAEGQGRVNIVVDSGRKKSEFIDPEKPPFRRGTDATTKPEP